MNLIKLVPQTFLTLPSPLDLASSCDTLLIFYTAPGDYISVSFPVIFMPDELTNRMLCVNVTIIPDSVVENDEMFRIVLNSSDSAVVLTQSTSTVDIIDSSSE